MSVQPLGDGFDHARQSHPVCHLSFDHGSSPSLSSFTVFRKNPEGTPSVTRTLFLRILETDSDRVFLKCQISSTWPTVLRMFSLRLESILHSSFRRTSLNSVCPISLIGLLLSFSPQIPILNAIT